MAERPPQDHHRSPPAGGGADRDAERAWTGDAQGYDAWFESPWGRYAWGVESRLLRAALAGAGHGRVLDVGCGTGRSSAVLRGPGTHIVGLDPDPGMLGLALARVDAAILAEGERLPFRDRVFDAAVAVTVLEFVREPAEVLAEMARVTRSPGRILVGALNPRSPWGAWHRRELQSEPWRTARFLSGRDLVRLGAAHGRVSLAEGLHAPGRLRGLERWGPAAEGLARRLRVPGAFRVLTIERR
ncbi:MAG TPA: class I SAM-dependent methyltransferase [Acidimicrobiales bacterium]